MKGYRCKLSCIVVDVNQTFPYIILFELASMLDGLWGKKRGEEGLILEIFQKLSNPKNLDLEPTLLYPVNLMGGNFSGNTPLHSNKFLFNKAALTLHE